MACAHIATDTEFGRSVRGAGHRPSVAEVGWRHSWAALLLTVVARSVLLCLASLMLWSVAPTVLGWHATVVVTGSMEPRLHVGDVVVSRPVAVNSVRVGQVALVDDPDHRGRLRLHRVNRINSDGTLTLKGDANRSADSSKVARSAVRGVGALRVPDIG